jgi:AcrR family transcriptional regulator
MAWDSELGGRQEVHSSGLDQRYAMMNVMSVPPRRNSPTAARGRPRLLTQEQIVETTLRLAKAQRLDDVSMKTLAGELSVPLTTLYNYVPNKDALHELVVDHVLRPVRIPSADNGPWDERLRQLERDARSAMAEYPGLSFTQGTGVAAEAVRLTQGVLSILEGAGFDAAASSLAFATLFTFMLGQIDVDTLGLASQALEQVTRQTQLSRDEVFEFGFAAVIAGLKATLPTRPATSKRARKRPTG